MMNMALYNARSFGSVSAWNFTISCSFTLGITSHGSKKPSITPLLTASGMAGSGIDTGVAPSFDKSLLVCRVGARILRPLKSASVLICLSRVCT